MIEASEVDKVNFYSPELREFLTQDWDVFDVDGQELLRKCRITHDHAPELVRMVGDAKLYEVADDEFTRLWQGPLLACRALGALGEASAVPAMLAATDADEESYEFWYDELPQVISALGPRVLADVDAHLNASYSGYRSRQVCALILEQLGHTHPEYRAEYVASLVKYLQQQRYSDIDDASANAAAISTLIKLGAVEAEATIEAVFALEIVNEDFCGSWSDVREDLFLGPEGRKAKIERLAAEAGRRWARTLNAFRAEAWEPSFEIVSSEPRESRVEKQWTRASDGPRPDPAKLVKQQKKQTRQGRKRNG